MNSRIVIYQTFPRLFGNKTTHPVFNGTIEQNGCGKFNDYTREALMAIRDLGVTHIWYTGIIEHGTTTDYSRYGIARDHPALIKGRAGSPYAIKDYYDVDPDLAQNVKNRMQEFEDLIQRTHDSGLKVIIDIVANHVFRQYHSNVKPSGIEDFGTNDDTSVSFHPDNNFYYLPGKTFSLPDYMPWYETIANEFSVPPYLEYPARATGNDVFSEKPGYEDWYETVKLNYGIDLQGSNQKYFDPIPDTWKKMVDILLFWAEKKIDGFRCDMAEMVPVEFWQFAIHQVKKKFPNVIFIAEIYNPLEYHAYIQQGGFDFLYDKVGLYDTLKNIITGGATTLALSNCWRVLEGLDKHMLRFIENHDEVRFASKHFAGDPFAALPAMLVVAAMNKGPVMIYNGQEVGENAEGASGFSGDDGKTTLFDYYIMPEHQKWMNGGKFDGGLLSKEQQRLRQFYQKILHMSLKQDAFVRGEFYDLMWANPYDSLPVREKLYIWLRHSPSQKLLCVANFDRKNGYKVKIRISDHALLEMGWAKCNHFKATELLWNKQKFEFTRKMAIEEGLPVELSPSDALVFEITPLDCIQ